MAVEAYKYWLASQLEEAFNNVGSSMMSDDFASKLLAWLYVEGGDSEIVTHNERLVTGFAIAQQKFKILGGETPNTHGVKLIQERVKELKEGNYSWVREIEEKYNVKLMKE